MREEEKTTCAVTEKELDRIFKVCRVLTLRDPHADIFCLAFDGDKYTKSSHVGKRMAFYPPGWGVVISNEKKRGYVSAFKYAEFLFALSVVPDRITQIACIGANHYDAGIADVLKRAGVTVVFDASGQTPYATPADGLVELVEVNGGYRLSYLASTPQGIRSYMDEIFTCNTIRAWEDALSFRVGSPYKSIDLDRLVKTLTFGHEKYAWKSQRETAEKGHWVRECSRTVRFADPDYNWDTFSHLSRELRVIHRFWKTRFKQFGITSDKYRDLDADEMCRFFEKTGLELGINHDVEAYYAGVPAEDILA